MGIQKNIEPSVMQELKAKYSQTYYGKPDNLVQALDKEFADYIEKYKDGSGSIVSPRTLRNFFDSENPRINARTLDFLTQLMLGDKYTVLVNQASQKQKYLPQKVNFLDPLLVRYREKTRNRIKNIIVLNNENDFELDELYTGTYFTDLQQKKDLDYVNLLRSILSETDLNFKSNRKKNRVFGLEQVKKNSRLFLVGRPGLARQFSQKK